MSRRTTSTLILLWLALAAGCGSEERAPSPKETGAASTPAGAPASPLAAAPGTSVVELRDGRVRLVSEGASQLAVLELLAAQAGFEVAASGVTPVPVALRLDGVTPEAAIAAVLEQDSYALEYVRDPEAGAHELVRVRVGETGPGSGAAVDAAIARVREIAREKQEEERAELRAREVRESSRRRLEETQRLRSEDPDRYARLVQERDAKQQDLRADLESEDPEQLVAALEDVDTDEGDARQRVIALAQTSPSPEVRAAAAEVLASDGSYVAVEALVGMLGDPEPSVLIATLEALEDAGDASLAPRVAPLADNADPAVRERAKETLDYWE